jgi:hypothetical protein
MYYIYIFYGRPPFQYGRDSAELTLATFGKVVRYLISFQHRSILLLILVLAYATGSINGHSFVIARARDFKLTPENPPRDDIDCLDFQRCAALHNGVLEHGWTSSDRSLDDKQKPRGGISKVAIRTETGSRHSFRPQ